jgi:hypothetical protein
MINFPKKIKRNNTRLTYSKERITANSYRICKLKNQDNNKLCKTKECQAKNSKKKGNEELGDNKMSPIMVKRQFIICEIVPKVGLFTTIVNTKVNFLMCCMFLNL